MPIYEYLCNSCGTKKEHMQKMSDAPIQVCPECGSKAYAKQISAAGFQLKGSGWYVTDFKNKPTQPSAKSGNSDTQSKSSGTQTDSAPTTSIASASSTNNKTGATESTAAD
ncbi:MAG: zinc ribbon domain-containing protein [Burkholderiales bacterium]|nr:zinc ribbon domain-containing protein [Burkholderiales bacterium]MDR4517836.1 zinc ribbon domain-containing protein [Nitrosomonas sp.]